MLKQRTKIVLSLLFFLSGITSSRGQETLCDSTGLCVSPGLCCENDPTPAGVMISHIHAKKEWMFSYRYMNMMMNGVLNADHSVSEAEIISNYQASPQDMRMNMHMMMMMYGITDKLTLMGMMHYNSAWMKMSMKIGSSYHRHSMATEGLGDIKFQLLYALLKQSHHQLILSIGGSIPFGSVNEKGKPSSMMYPNRRYPYNMQNGTGTFDLLPTVSYLGQSHKLYYSFQINALVRLGHNMAGYRHGNEYSALGWMAYRWSSNVSSSLRLEGICIGKMHGADSTLNSWLEMSADAKNYGGKKINAYVGSVFQPHKGLFKTSKFCMEYGFPLYQYFNGYQMSNKQQFLITYNLNF